MPKNLIWVRPTIFTYRNGIIFLGKSAQTTINEKPSNTNLIRFLYYAITAFWAIKNKLSRYYKYRYIKVADETVEQL